MKKERHETGGVPRRLFWIVALLLAVPAVALGTGVRPAAAATVVNATFHVPAQVDFNPCFPDDILNLNGDIHVVITTTADRRGGYHIVNQLNSNLSGASITSGTRYVNNENTSEDWYARPPFPAVHTHTYDFLVLSQSDTPNYVLHMTMHETVNAGGTPTATVTNFRLDCQG